MSRSIPDSQTISDIWEAVKNRSIPVKPLTKPEWDVLDDTQKNSDIVYIVSGSDSISIIYHRKTLSGEGSIGNPVGTIISYMGLTAPTGYLICDGTVYDIDDHPDLANHIEAQFGDVKYFGGNGTTTFAVPDMRNLFLRGYHGASSEKLSGDIGKKQAATPIPNTSMGYTSGAAHLLGLQVSESSTFNYTTKDYDTAIASSIQRGIKITTGAASGGVPATFTARPVNMAVLYCIKT